MIIFFSLAKIRDILYVIYYINCVNYIKEEFTWHLESVRDGYF